MVSHTRKKGRRGRDQRPSPFSARDYTSGNGMRTALWGPPFWHCLHSLSFNYPVHPSTQEKRQYRAFILSLRHVLPCGKCRKNLVTNLAKLPLTLKHMESRDTFSRYIFELHELVNTMLEKKSGLTFAEVRDRYEQFRSRCGVAPETRKRKRETGCTEPLYDGTKAKCVLKIVPESLPCASLIIDEKCVLEKNRTQCSKRARN
jgi:hypothetical protein